jgi:hypothetical protein
VLVPIVFCPFLHGFTQQLRLKVNSWNATSGRCPDQNLSISLGIGSAPKTEGNTTGSLVRISYLKLAHMKFAAASTLPEPLYVAT